MQKQYVEVVVKFLIDGTKIPLSIKWITDEIFKIDKVLEVKNRASLKVGGFGERYLVKINGYETYLYFEFDKWFVERKD